MAAWWNELSTLAHIFVCIAAPATLVLIVQTVLMLIGIGDHGADGADAPDVGDGADAGFDGDIPADTQVDFDDGAGGGVFGGENADGDHVPSGAEGLRLFSVRGIIAFAVVFGWMGAALDSAGLMPALTVIISAACGFAMMVLIALLFKAAMRLQSDGTLDIRNALGVSGTVYLTVPAKRAGAGKVTVTVQGTYCEYSAVTDSEQPIETGREVTVTGISGQSTLVVIAKQ